MAVSAVERHRDVVELASVRPLSSRETPDPEPVAIPLPSRLPSRSRVADFVTPPDIWSDDRPSLQKIWLYGVYGRWTDAYGLLRLAGAAYATVVAFPLHALLYLGLWLVERPARFLVAATVAALIHFAF